MEVLDLFYPHITHTLKLPSRIFGCASFVHFHRQQRGKLDPRAIKRVFLGYFVTQKSINAFILFFFGREFKEER